MAASEDRSTLERALAHEDARALPPEQFALWNEMTTMHRMVVCQGRIFVVWKAGTDGTPRPVNSLRVTRVEASFSCGVALTLLDARQQSVVVTQTPSKLPEDDLFLWCPYLNDVRWTQLPSSGRRKALRLALAVRMRSHPQWWQYGHTYITEVGAFRRQYPQFIGTKF